MDASWSLLWLRDADSMSTRPQSSRSSLDIDGLSVRFPFDEELLGSRVYQSIFASLMRNSIAQSRRPPPRERAPQKYYVSDHVPRRLVSQNQDLDSRNVSLPPSL